MIFWYSMKVDYYAELNHLILNYLCGIKCRNQERKFVIKIFDKSNIQFSTIQCTNKNPIANYKFLVFG